MTFNGADMSLGNITKLSDAETRSITAENVYGEKGRAGMAEGYQLGSGYPGSPN